MSQAPFDFDAFLNSPAMHNAENPYPHESRGHAGPPMARHAPDATSNADDNMSYDHESMADFQQSALADALVPSTLANAAGAKYSMSSHPSADLGSSGGMLNNQVAVSGQDDTMGLAAVGGGMAMAMGAMNPWGYSVFGGAPALTAPAANLADTFEQAANSDMAAAGTFNTNVPSIASNGRSSNGVHLRPEYAANAYRHRIAAHHSSQLRQGLGQYAALQPGAIDGRLPSADGGQTAPGSHPLITSFDSPSVPLSQAARIEDPSARRGHSLQERRRRLAQKGTVERQPEDLDNNVHVSGRNQKRGMDTSDGRIRDPKISAGQTPSAPASGADGIDKALVVPPTVKTQTDTVLKNDVELTNSPILCGGPQPYPPRPQGALGRSKTGDPSFPGLYSSSGFDMLGALMRVASRTNPRITIGPVDMSCSFTVSDARHPDHPIVYASDTFSKLTGYESHEILGRNCRFLQAPDGNVAKNSRRRHTDNSAVSHFRKHMSSKHECQASLINYRKGGQPFINLVTIVPITWDSDDIAYFVGFQVDLVEQPGAILEKMRDGSYMVNYSSTNEMVSRGIAAAGDDAETVAVDTEASKQASMAQELADLIGSGSDDTKQWARVLLENSQDLIHVLSLKGAFRYVSPSVERILGYKPEELIGKCISEFCHPSDVVPVFRELKDSTSNASIAAAARKSGPGEHAAGQSGPQVNLLLRMRHKDNSHHWIESIGKLHLEQGKGRKVVVSSGRLRPVYNLAWDYVRQSAHLKEPSFWSKLSTDGLFLSSTVPVLEVLGISARFMAGSHLAQMTHGDSMPALLQALRAHSISSVPHVMTDVHGDGVSVRSTFYPSNENSLDKLPPSVFVHTQRANADGNFDIAAPSAEDGAAQRAKDAAFGTGAGEASSVFAELSTFRSSSWVFELHQLKNVNKRLREEFKALHRRSTRPALSIAQPGNAGTRRGLTTHALRVQESGQRLLSSSSSGLSSSRDSFSRLDSNSGSDSTAATSLGSGSSSDQATGQDSKFRP